MTTTTNNGTTAPTAPRTTTPTTPEELCELLFEMMPGRCNAHPPRAAMTTATEVLAMYVAPSAGLRPDVISLDDMAHAVGGLFLRGVAFEAREQGLASTIDLARDVGELMTWTESRPRTSIERFVRFWFAAHVALAERGAPIEIEQDARWGAEWRRMGELQRRTEAAQLFTLATEALGELDVDGLQGAQEHVLSVLALLRGDREVGARAASSAGLAATA